MDELDYVCAKVRIHQAGWLFYYRDPEGDVVIRYCRSDFTLTQLRNRHGITMPCVLWTWEELETCMSSHTPTPTSEPSAPASSASTRTSTKGKKGSK